jgi:hypothetical protein
VGDAQDMETEVFLHLLQRNAADAGDPRAAASAAVAHSGDAGPRRCAPPCRACPPPRCAECRPVARVRRARAGAAAMCRRSGASLKWERQTRL